MSGQGTKAEPSTSIPLPTAWPEPEISVEGPREVEFTAGTQAGLLALRLLSIGSVAIGLPIVLSGAEVLERLATKGQVVLADVVDKREHRGKSTTYSIDYRFTLAAKTVTGSETVPEAEYDQITPGQSVVVTALPSSPDVHRYGYVTVEDARAYQLNGSLLVGGIALVIGFATVAFRLHAREERRILKTWRALPAQTIEITSESAGKSGTTFNVRYRARLPSGQVREDTHSVTQHGELDLAVGRFFTVLQCPSHPKWLRPLFEIKTVEVVSSPTRRKAPKRLPG